MKTIVAALLLAWGAVSASADGLYFDIGLGLGKATTEVDGQNMSDLFGSSVKENGVDLSLKAGYGPFGSVPIYVVGELGGIGHRFEDSYNYVQFNSYLVGPGVIFYPTPLFQLAASVGYSYTNNQTDLPTTFYQSTGGYAGNVSAAFDWGDGDNGLLLGLKYFFAKNTLEVSGAEENASEFSLFVKWAYRQKIAKE